MPGPFYASCCRWLFWCRWLFCPRTIFFVIRHSLVHQVHAKYIYKKNTLFVKHHWTDGRRGFIGDRIAFYHLLTYIADTVSSLEIGPGRWSSTYVARTPRARAQARTERPFRHS
jgi:hypothetical protein